MSFDPSVQASNRTLIEGLTSNDPYINKEAAGLLDKYLGIRAREDGIFQKIIPQVNVSWDQLDKQVDTIKPCIIREMEPNSTAAYSLPFGGVPFNTYLGAPRYRIVFDRIKSRRFTADVMNLRGYTMDIRQVFNDLMLKDIIAEEDRKFIAVVDSQVGTVDTASGTRYTEVAAKGYISLGGAPSRATLALLAEGLPSTNRHLDPAVSLVNNITIKKLLAMDHDDIGGPLAEELFIKGFTEKTIMGTKWYVTIKTDLVPTNIVYQFAAPDYLGDNLCLEDVTVSTKTENYMFEMFAYKCSGGSVKNLGAFCKATFSGASAGTWA